MREHILFVSSSRTNANTFRSQRKHFRQLTYKKLNIEKDELQRNMIWKWFVHLFHIVSFSFSFSFLSSNLLLSIFMKTFSKCFLFFGRNHFLSVLLSASFRLFRSHFYQWRYDYKLVAHLTRSKDGILRIQRTSQFFRMKLSEEKALNERTAT